MSQPGLVGITVGENGFLIYILLLLCMWAHAPWQAYGGQRTTLWVSFWLHVDSED